MMGNNIKQMAASGSSAADDSFEITPRLFRKFLDDLLGYNLDNVCFKLL